MFLHVKVYLTLLVLNIFLHMPNTHTHIDTLVFVMAYNIRSLKVIDEKKVSNKMILQNLKFICKHKKLIVMHGSLIQAL